MKIKYWKNVFLLGTLALIVSCENDDDDGDIMGNGQFDSADVAALQNSVESGTWRITRFVDDGEDETSNYEGFVFTFGADGSIVADNGTTSFNGTWRVELDDDDDLDDLDDLELYITFSTSDEAIDELSEDWYVLEFSDNRIRLADDDDDDTDNDDDFLTFERS